jgi:molybdenum cofactor biosynthesis enzyme MoaA
MLFEHRSTEPIKSLDWRITDCCNYQCEYCIERQYDQKSFHNRFSDQKTISKILDTILILPGSWQIKFGNGEPTMHPLFLDICDAISNSRHTIRLITNFSLPREKLKQLIDICGAKLDFVTASLHLGETDVEEFIEKINMV